MFDSFLAQILALALIFFCSARVFFLKHSRIDCFAVFAPCSLLVSLFSFFCFGFSILNLAVFLLSILVFLTNFRAILRLNAQLIIDGYSIVFIVFSILCMILAVGLGVLIFLLRPVKYTAKDFSIKKTEYALTGNSKNLKIRESFFSGERFSGNFFIYEPIAHDEINAEIYSENPILLFAGSVCGEIQNYEPYFMILAQKGYKILAADFFMNDFRILSDFTENSLIKELYESHFFRRFAATQLFENFRKNQFEQIIEKEKSLANPKYSALTHLALEFLGDDAKFFYIVDNVDFDSIYSVIDEFNTEPYSNAVGFFSMNRVDEYKTNGYGFIEQTDILLARQKGFERENKFFIARYVANKTIKAIEEQK